MTVFIAIMVSLCQEKFLKFLHCCCYVAVRNIFLKGELTRQEKSRANCKFCFKSKDFQPEWTKIMQVKNEFNSTSYVTAYLHYFRNTISDALLRQSRNLLSMRVPIITLDYFHVCLKLWRLLMNLSKLMEFQFLMRAN